MTAGCGRIIRRVGAAGDNQAALQPSPREDLRFEVVSVLQRTPVIVELRLRPVDGPLAYLPGQYALVGDLAGKRTVRSYSFANAPRSDGVVTLLVTRIPGGQLSTWLHNVEPGAELLLSGPYGTFVADLTESDPVLFLAGGSGLAPVRALIEAGLANARRPPMTLLFSARTTADLIDDDGLRRWDSEHDHFRYLRTLTRGSGPPPTGRIPEVLAGLLPPLERHRVYIAGESGFVSACSDAARRHGASPAHVFVEEFFVDARDGSGAKGTERGES
jgi:CDP-4-dehydro-6-deoxyglucose reductase